MILHFVIIVIVVEENINTELNKKTKINNNSNKKLEKRKSYSFLNIYEEILQIKEKEEKVYKNKEYLPSSPIPIPIIKHK